MNLGEDNACKAVMDFDRVRRNLCLPRYTPSGWWECDVFELTDKNYFREYEVKLSLNDFKIDAKKDRRIRGTDRLVPHADPLLAAQGRTSWVCDYEKKHDLIAKGDSRGPVQFWFVTPVDLIPRELLPSWAGLIELKDQGGTWQPTRRWVALERVKAPRLHDTQRDPKQRTDLFKTCYYRFHDAWTRNLDREKVENKWSDEEATPIEAPPPQTVG